MLDHEKVVEPQNHYDHKKKKDGNPVLTQGHAPPI